MKLTITAEDIEKAEHDSWDNCPIARAAKRTWPGNRVEVYDQYISVNGDDFGHTEDTSRVLETWDEGWELIPVEIDFPNVINSLIPAK